MSYSSCCCRARPHQGQGPTAGSICVRLVDAFYARSASSTAHQPPPSSSQQQGSFGGGSAAAAADEHEDAVALACLEAKRASARFYRGINRPRLETGRLTGFCAHTLPILLAPLLHDAEVLGEADDEVAMMAISAASALLAACATALVSCDAAASDELAKLICSDHIRRALHHVRLEEAQADLATAMSAILSAPCLSVPRRAFALEMAKPALGLLRQMSDATNDVPGSVEAHRGSHLAASLLRGLCRLPAASARYTGWRGGHQYDARRPDRMHQGDLRDSRPIEATSLEPKLPHIEFLLLRLQHSGLVETTPGASGGTPAASDGDGTISEPYARSCLDALAHYLTSRSALLHIATAELPSPAVRDLGRLRRSRLPHG